MIFDVSLDLYKIFCTVVKTGNMSTAAKELYISQPAVSMAIRQLEDRLGKPLLLRSSKGIKTTVEGSVLYEYLRQALSLVETAEKKYMELVNLDIGEIRIGAGSAILAQYVTPFIQRFTQSYPNIAVKVTDQPTYETIKLLKCGRIDAGFIHLPIVHDENLDIYECLQIHDCIIGGTKFQYLQETGVSLSDLKSFPLLLLEKECNSRKYIDSYTNSQGVILESYMELNNSDLLVQFASVNFGLAIVIREFVQKQLLLSNLFEIPLNPAIPGRSIGMVTLKNISLSYAASNFTELFRQERQQIS